MIARVFNGPLSTRYFFPPFTGLSDFFFDEERFFFAPAFPAVTLSGGYLIVRIVTSSGCKASYVVVTSKALATICEADFRVAYKALAAPMAISLPVPIAAIDPC